jgi:hypothetical protein
MQVIEAQSARSWGLAITSITTDPSMRAHHDLVCAPRPVIVSRLLAAQNESSLLLVSRVTSGFL